MTLVFPIAFQQFMLALVSASDAMMLGMLAQDSLSAVSLASQIAFVENLFLAAMTIGLSMLAAQYWGKQDRAAVERLFAYVLKGTAAVSFGFFLAGLCLPEFLMRLFTDDPSLIGGGAVYLRTVSFSFFLTGLSQIYLCVLKNTVKIRYLLHDDSRLQHDFWKYTAPVLGNEMVWGLGFTMSSVMMGHLGSDAVAANSVANIVKNLVACFCLGLGSGGGIMVGNELGAGRPETAKEYGRKLCKLSILCGTASGLLLLFLRPLILAATDLTGTASHYLQWMLVMCSYYMIGKSINSTTVAGIFCAGGDSKFGFLCDTITLWCITVPLGLIATFVLKLPVLVVYWIVTLDEMVKLPAVYRHYTKYKWVKDLTVKEHVP